MSELTDRELWNTYWETTQELDRRGGGLDTYAAPHVWNLVAKILRESYPGNELLTDARTQVERRTIEGIAFLFAERFNQDENFDPIAWLDKCSPDPELYPFSELWEE